MAATLLSYVSSKDQLKWQGTKESLLTFLSSRLQVDSSDIQVKDNGTCSVVKAKGMTFNFYIKAKTLQIQGKENANQLRADLVNLACTENSNKSDTPELDEQDGVEASLPSEEEGDEDKNTMAYQPSTVNLDSSTFEGPYASYFNMHNRDTLKIKAIKSNDPHDWANFKRMRNKVNTEIKAAKKVFYNNKFIENNGDPRKTWQTINDLTSRKAVHSSIREINLKGTFISESSDLSNAFNDHFSSIGSTLANDIPLSDETK